MTESETDYGSTSSVPPGHAFGLAPPQFGRTAGLDRPAQLLHVEVLSPAEGKILYRSMFVFLALGFLAILSQVVFVHTSGAADLDMAAKEGFARKALRRENIISMVIGAALLGWLMRWGVRVAVSRRARFEWSHRRRRLTAVALLNASGMAVVLLSHLFANIYEAVWPCAWFDIVPHVAELTSDVGWIIVLFTLFARVRCLDVWAAGPQRHSIMLDARCPNVMVMWPLAVLWEASSTAHAVSTIRNRDTFLSPADTELCRQDQDRFLREHWDRINCVRPQIADLGLRGVQLTLVLYIIALSIMAWRSHRRLRAKQREDFRLSFMLYGLYRRFHLPAVGLGVLDVALLATTSPNDAACLSYAYRREVLVFLVWFLSLTAVFDLYLFVPECANGPQPVPLELRQMYAWTERTKPGVAAVRRRLAHGLLDTGTPLFCTETAVNALYWSTLAYRRDPGIPRRKTFFSDKVAAAQCMAWYGLKQQQEFEHHPLGLRVLLAWGDTHIVLAARGTVNLVNARQDLRIGLTRLHPGKANSWRKQPKIHRGFADTWRSGGVNTAIVQKVAELVAASNDPGSMRILATGHSLGGALATLAILQIAEEVPGLGQQQLSLYTYGAPRVGNRAFARYADERVPDTWHVINDQDAFTRWGKFLRYKRGGQRALVGSRGGLVVKPSALEISLNLSICGAAPHHHSLRQYERSLFNICRSHAANDHASNGSSEAAILLNTHAYLSAVGDADQSQGTATEQNSLGEGSSGFRANPLALECHKPEQRAALEKATSAIDMTPHT